MRNSGFKSRAYLRRTLCTAAACGVVTLSSAASAVDLLLYNGQFYGEQDTFTFVAIEKGRIVEVGGQDAAQRLNQLQQQADQSMDLAGRTVIAGLHDSHVHTMMGVAGRLACQISNAAQLEGVLDTVAACVAELPPGSWVVGAGYDENILLGQESPRALLDRVSPEHPVHLLDISRHTVWLNSAALRQLDITAETPVPEGGAIDRGSDGQSNGILRETARNLSLPYLPKPSEEQMLEGLQALGQEMLSYGITSYSDAGILSEDLALFAKAKDSGVLPQTVRGCLRWGRGDDGRERRAQYQRPGLVIDCMKIQLDGVPTTAKTAVMLAPYERHGDDLETRGLISHPRDQIIANVVAWDAQGLTVKMHAAGDGAVQIAVDAVEAARQVNGASGLIHDVSHISFADTNDFSRMRELGGALEFSPYLFNPQPIVNDIRYAVGDQRMQGWIPMRDGFDSGALVIVGSDWPVVDDFNPWPAIEAMVTRQNPGGVDEPINPGQRVSLSEVMLAYTQNAAKQSARAEQAGSIAVGKRADLAVLNQAIFDIPSTALHRTRAALVFLDGKLVYRAE